MGKQTSLQEHGRTGEAGGKRADRYMRSERAAGGARRAMWEGDVSLYERTKIGHGCLGETSLGGVTRQLTLHPEVVVVLGGG